MLITSKEGPTQPASSPAVTEESETLQDRIFLAFQPSKTLNGVDTEFLPLGKLHDLISHQSVYKELSSKRPSGMSNAELNSTAKQICPETIVIRDGTSSTRSFRKIFAVLVLLDISQAIFALLKENVSDTDLPLSLVEHSGIKRLSRRGSTDRNASNKIQAFARWSTLQLQNFQEKQWKFLAPVFSQDPSFGVQNYALRDQDILPLVVDMQNHGADKIGGYGKVSMVNIHEDHHKFPIQLLGLNGFAIKQQMAKEDRVVFTRESEILKELSGSNQHRHISPLLATFEQFGRMHLIFYRATGDMIALCEDLIPKPVLDQHNTTWIAEQCAGLAGGLESIQLHMSAVKDEEQSG